MKHVFVVNPHAGKRDATDFIRLQISRLPSDVDTEVYVTRGPGDATRFVSRRCADFPDGGVRFYACGGDGTINEVVSGLVPFPAAEMTCIPTGSGNDYLKYYGHLDCFSDLSRLVNGQPHWVDVMRVNDRYSLNVCNFGFDAIVCKTMIQVRRKPVVGGRNAYTTGIVKALFTGRRTCCRIAVDGHEVHDGDMLLCTLGNGRYVGGAYKCSPRSLNDDGLIEVCLFRPLSIVSFARLLGSYRDGTFIDRPDVQPKMTYLRGGTVDISAPGPIDLCVDGEMLRSSSFHVVQLPRAVRFVVPLEVFDSQSDTRPSSLC